MSTPGFTPDEWALLEKLFTEVESVSTTERDAWIAKNCPTDRIRQALERLLGDDTMPTGGVAALGPGRAVLSDWLSHQEQADFPRDLGNYVLEREIGIGGSARVFPATRKSVGGRVAIKLLRFDAMASDEARRRFEFEHRLLAQLEHPNIARLLEAGVTTDGVAFLAMEFVEGQPITEYCRGRPLRERMAVFRQACAAVAHAHRRGIIHRDVKPGNILVDERGHAKLLDFGIGKLQDAEAAVAMPHTRAQFQLMTRQYAAPEQLLGKEVTTLTDVYALGVVLYELLAGERPFVGAERDRGALERAVTRSVPPNPSSHARELPARDIRGDLDAITLKALRLEPELRYPGAGLLGEDVQRWLDGRAVDARGGNRLYRARKFVGRHRWPVTLAFTAVAFLAVYLVRESALRREAETALATS